MPSSSPLSIDAFCLILHTRTPYTVYGKNQSMQTEKCRKISFSVHLNDVVIVSLVRRFIHSFCASCWQSAVCLWTNERTMNVRTYVYCVCVYSDFIIFNGIASSNRMPLPLHGAFAHISVWKTERNPKNCFSLVRIESSIFTFDNFVSMNCVPMRWHTGTCGYYVQHLCAILAIGCECESNNGQRQQKQALSFCRIRTSALFALNIFFFYIFPRACCCWLVNTYSLLCIACERVFRCIICSNILSHLNSGYGYQSAIGFVFTFDVFDCVHLDTIATSHTYTHTQ